VSTGGHLVTIHSEHPFLPPEPDRDPVRRLRARVGATVTLWTAGAGAERAGLTVSSYLVAAGEPSRVVALLHPESDLLERLEEEGTAVVALLGWRQRDVADVFAGVRPAPGGPFRSGSWEQTAWGPRLLDVPTWAGVRRRHPRRRVVASGRGGRRARGARRRRRAAGAPARPVPAARRLTDLLVAQAIP
jgi:hypothetical protein